ncbi:hypothetical protein [Carboxylicivirga marina]
MVMVMTVMVAGAQEKESKGMWIGGGFGFEGGDYDGWNLSPQWGMMLNEKMGVGGNLIISDDDWMIEPYFRYYLGVTDNFKFFGDGALAFGGGDNYSAFRIQVRPGMQYWFNSKWSMAAATELFTYHNIDDDNDAFDETRTFLGVDATNLTLSVYFHF